MEEVLLGVLIGWAVIASLFGAIRLHRPPPVVSTERRAMQDALHAATVTLPYLRAGLSTDSSAKTIGYLLALNQAIAVALTTADGEVLAFAGEGSDHHLEGDPLVEISTAGRGDRIHISSRVACPYPACPLGPAVLAPLVVQNERVGTFAAMFAHGHRLTPDDTRTATETASLVSAQLELAEMEAQGQRLARAELRALRAQISPHFVYNALAAIASYIHSNPDEARELLTEFAEFTRYAFRRQSPYVTIADELAFVEKYLRLEHARFGDRLDVRLRVAPDVLQTVMPMLSVQPLVENAIRHGVERRGQGRIEIVGSEIGTDVELRVSDDGVGMEVERREAILNGQTEGIGLINVHSRLRAAFGQEYGLEIDSQPGEGTTVTMTLPKFRAGVRAA